MLESLTWQEPTSAMEILAVDNGSDDRSRSIAESFADRLNLKILEALDRRNASYARNVGVRASTCDKLLFADADDQLAPGYVAAMTAALDHHRFVTSRVDSMALNPEWVQLAHGDPWQADSVPVGFDFMPVTGPNVGLRRELFDASGGYSGRLLRLSGHRLRLESSARRRIDSLRPRSGVPLPAPRLDPGSVPTVRQLGLFGRPSLPSFPRAGDAPPAT